jgi:pimeloyl-ACP methyl ester carboxylesterase
MTRNAILIGGIGTSGDYLLKLKSELENCGLAPVTIGSKGLLRGNWQDSVLDKTLQCALTTYFAAAPRPLPRARKPILDPDFDVLIGYSFGGLVAAQAALKRKVTNQLVLIAAPLGPDLLAVVRSSDRVQKTLILDLKAEGDPLYAGMKTGRIFLSLPELIRQYRRCSGHFLYIDSGTKGDKARARLAAGMVEALR